MALIAEGHSAEAIGPMVGVTGRTVQNWVRRFREVSLNEETPEMMDDWVRIIRRSQGMQHAVLDVAEFYATMAQNDHPGPLAEIARQVASKELMKHALLYNIYAGTGTDKMQKPTQQPIQAQNVQINFIFEERPDVGEVVE
ncbi:hypothetical protein LCGC14_2708780 [marine sediment metagenome]|uniref:Uncharacterized protein n=1 Tax=marine sediment metagenome TaxID=412755 RepID=A0A0F8ZDP8_9ZZZZ